MHVRAAACLGVERGRERSLGAASAAEPRPAKDFKIFDFKKAEREGGALQQKGISPGSSQMPQSPKLVKMSLNSCPDAANGKQ